MQMGLTKTLNLAGLVLLPEFHFTVTMVARCMIAVLMSKFCWRHQSTQLVLMCPLFYLHRFHISTLYIAYASAENSEMFRFADRAGDVLRKEFLLRFSFVV